MWWLETIILPCILKTTHVLFRDVMTHSFSRLLFNIVTPEKIKVSA